MSALFALKLRVKSRDFFIYSSVPIQLKTPKATPALTGPPDDSAHEQNIGEAPACPTVKALIAHEVTAARVTARLRERSERTLAAFRTGLCLEILQTVGPRVAPHRRDCARPHDSDDRGTVWITIDTLNAVSRMLNAALNGSID